MSTPSFLSSFLSGWPFLSVQVHSAVGHFIETFQELRAVKVIVQFGGDGELVLQLLTIHYYNFCII